MLFFHRPPQGDDTPPSLQIAPLLRMCRWVGIVPQRCVLMFYDMASLAGCLLAALLGRAVLGGMDLDVYFWILGFVLCTGPCLNAAFGLYRTGRMPAYRELQAVFSSVSLLYGTILFVLFISKSADIYSRAALSLGWVLTLCVVPLARRSCRRRFCLRRWWGEPAVILDQSASGRQIWHYLRQHPDLELRPVALSGLSGGREKIRPRLEALVNRYPDAVALVWSSPLKGADADYVSDICRCFGKVLILNSVEELRRRQWFTPYELGNMTALLVQQNLRSRWRKCLKRALALCIAVPLSLLCLLPGLLLMLLIRIDSRGPAIFRHRRIGRNGKTFAVLKFRTMAADGDALLESYLAAHPEARAEWETDRKLRHDPRVTRLGAFLRGTSLDELPQLLNVLAGSMSLVGPRPIVEEEVAKYGDAFPDYCRVAPGLTGLWQISGRSNTTYAERVELDRYYVCNWSVWLDLWILAKTPSVVLSRDGAC